jgi:hypothetical protein
MNNDKPDKQEYIQNLVEPLAVAIGNGLDKELCYVILRDYHSHILTDDDMDMVYELALESLTVDTTTTNSTEITDFTSCQQFMDTADEFFIWCDTILNEEYGTYPMANTDSIREAVGVILYHFDINRDPIRDLVITTHYVDLVSDFLLTNDTYENYVKKDWDDETSVLNPWRNTTCDVDMSIHHQLLADFPMERSN